MEYKHKQMQVQEVGETPATERQRNYLERLAKELGFHLNTKKLNQKEASEKIEQFMKLRKMESRLRHKDVAIKLAMVKKLIHKKWVAQNKEINKQTDKLFIREVFYLYRIFDQIDGLIITEQLD